MTKKEDDMQTQSVLPPLPSLPKTEHKELMQAEINEALYEAVERERKKRKITKRKVLEYGLVAFLQMANPTAAEPFIKKLESQG